MEPPEPSAPLPPFLDAVRRRHPDVDMVVLPPEQPPAHREVLDDATVAAVLERVDTVAGEVWSGVGDGNVRTSLGYGPDEGTVVARSRGTALLTEGPRVLAALRERLSADGWRFRRPQDGVHRLVGRRDDLSLRALYARGSGAFLVEVSSAPLPVGRDRAPGLVRP